MPPENQEEQAIDAGPEQSADTEPSAAVDPVSSPHAETVEPASVLVDVSTSEVVGHMSFDATQEELDREAELTSELTGDASKIDRALACVDRAMDIAADIGAEAGMTADEITAASTPTGGLARAGQQIPSMGRIVIYQVTEQDAVNINWSREDAKRCRDRHRKAKTGVMVHVGNPVFEGDEYPMIIVRVWGNGPNAVVNGKALLDGTDELWVTSASRGDDLGEWQWPARV